MRITNITPDPRHVSYASTSSGGRTLKAGEASPELPLSVALTNPLVLKDLDNGLTALRLSEDDKRQISRLQQADQAAIPAVKPREKAKPAKAKKPVTTLVNPVNTPKGIPHIAPVVKAGSLAALQQENARLSHPMNPSNTPKGVPSFR